MDQIATVEEILAGTETTADLPGLSGRLGAPRRVRIRRIGRAEYLSLLPPLPPGAHEWPREEWAARELAWIETLPPEALEARRQQARDVLFRVVALATIEPALTLEQARRLGDDALVVAAEVLRFSGLAPEPAAEQEVAPEAEASSEPAARAA